LMHLFGNAIGNSIVSGLSSKSNSQSESEANQHGKQAYEKAIAANIPHEQAKLLAAQEVLASLSPDKRQKVSIAQDGDTLQIANNRLDRSKGGITMSGTNAVDSIMVLTSRISDVTNQSLNAEFALPQPIRWRMMYMSYMHYMSYGGFMLSLRLDTELESRLAKLADLTGRTKTFYAKEAIQRYLDEMEETYLALSRLEKPGKRLSMADVDRELGLDD